MDWSQAKDVATVIGGLAAVFGGLIALVTFVKSVLEYVNQGVQKRAEHFIEMRRRLKENETFKQLCALLETDDPALAAIPFADKRDFLGFFEEVALMLNSGLIRKEVVHYMFGYYALRCWESEHFWQNGNHGVNRDSIYWSLFRDFTQRMQEAEREYRYTRRRFRF